MTTFTTIITISPPIECHRCHRLADIAVVCVDTGIFEPSCPIHLFIAPPREGSVDPRLDVAWWEREAIRRLVHFLCGDDVHVEGIESIPLLLLSEVASEWALEEDEAFAWRATATIAGKSHLCEAVFSAADWVYTLFLDGEKWT